MVKSFPNSHLTHIDQEILLPLCSTEKERAPTLCNSMDGTGEYYAKWNKPGSEGQIPYNLTFNWT